MGEAVEDVVDQRQIGGGTERQGPGESEVMLGEAIADGRTEDGVVSQFGSQAAGDGVSDGSVGVEGEVGSVLL
jgi:hypothetical protein